jgi:hypothetical protein
MAEKQLSKDQLEQGLDYILESPKDLGELKLIVCRPDVDQRKVVEKANLDKEQGLIGDNWLARGSSATENGSAHPEMQLNIMNARVAELVAGGTERMPLAGDQLYLDLDLSSENLPPGTRLQLGDAIIEVTEPPHTGCKKFAARFGTDAVVFVNSGFGREQNFRGICARVVQGGTIKADDVARKIA